MLHVTKKVKSEVQYNHNRNIVGFFLLKLFLATQSKKNLNLKKKRTTLYSKMSHEKKSSPSPQVKLKLSS